MLANRELTFEAIREVLMHYVASLTDMSNDLIDIIIRGYRGP